MTSSLPPADTETDRRADTADVAGPYEAYETEDGVVVFDAQNPLAWLSARRTVRLHEMA